METIKSANELIRAFLVREVFDSRNAGKLADTTPLSSSGILDSIGKMKLISFLEATFGVAIDLEDVEAGHLETIQSIEKLVLSRKAR